MRNGISARVSRLRQDPFGGPEWNGLTASAPFVRAERHSAADNGSSAFIPRVADSGTSEVGGKAKRWFDVGVALSAIVLLLPLFCLIAIAVRLIDRGPVLYRHSRIGRSGKSFDCLKFRTMQTNGDEILRRHLSSNPAAAGEWAQKRKLTIDPRITPLGGVLRASSLDELPQLLNILRGDMSFVGPRPIVEAEISKYGEHIADYLRARPGLTGLWQVNGRNNVDYRDRIKFDCDYVENWSFYRDLVIIIRTFRVVFTRDGCY